jgi:hypothetical protein
MFPLFRNRPHGPPTVCWHSLQLSANGAEIGARRLDVKGRKREFLYLMHSVGKDLRHFHRGFGFNGGGAGFANENFGHMGGFGGGHFGGFGGGHMGGFGGGHMSGGARSR